MGTHGDPWGPMGPHGKPQVQIAHNREIPDFGLKKKRIKNSMKLILLVKNGYKGIFLTVFLALGAHGDPWGPGPGPRKL